MLMRRSRQEDNPPPARSAPSAAIPVLGMRQAVALWRVHQTSRLRRCGGGGGRGLCWGFDGGARRGRGSAGRRGAGGGGGAGGVQGDALGIALDGDLLDLGRVDRAIALGLDAGKLLDRLG